MEINIIGPEDPALAVAQEAIKAHPEWKASLTIHPWAEYHDVLMASLTADVSPNQAVFVPGHVWIPELAEKGFLSALDPLLKRIPQDIWLAYQRENILENVADESRFGDQSYMVPTFTDGHILFYRSDLLELDRSRGIPIVSPLDLAGMAAKLHKPPETYGMALKAHPSEILFDWLPFLLESGGQVLDPSLQPAFYNEAGVRALRAYHALRAFCPADTHTYGNLEIASVLREGKAGLVTTWGGQAAPIFLDEMNPYRHLYKAAIYPHPCGATWGITIPANQPEDRKVRALQIALSINGPAQDVEIIVKAGSPVRETSYTPEAFERFSWLQAQYEMVKRMALLPKHPVIDLVLGPLAEAVIRVFTDELGPEEALNEANSAIKALLAT